MMSPMHPGIGFLAAIYLIIICILQNGHGFCFQSTERWSFSNGNDIDQGNSNSNQPTLCNSNSNRRDVLSIILATPAAVVIPAVSTASESTGAGTAASTAASSGEPKGAQVHESPEEPTEEERREELRQRLIERRQLMEASRTSNSRQSYLDLSRQRAALYNTTSKAVSCPPNIPCL